MIKTIKKIDLQGNETWQEVCQCNRCKRILDPNEYVYETKWTAWYPLKPSGCSGWGFAEGTNPVKHICETCQKDVEAFINGEYEAETKKHSCKLTTFEERVEAMVDAYDEEASEALVELYYSHICSVESGEAIKRILIKRGVMVQ